LLQQKSKRQKRLPSTVVANRTEFKHLRGLLPNL
jgi:hypothetical protein